MRNYLLNHIEKQPNKMISYYEYMDLTLYHPQFGYYMKNGQKIGRNGDFITSSNISNIMGKVFSRWYAELVKNQSHSPRVCEVGAGNGRFAYAFLQEWYKGNNPEIEYIIIEKSPFHRKLQKDLFANKWTVTQKESIDHLTPFNGLIFSNELFDALPVHVIKRCEGELLEIMVTSYNGQLTEIEKPLSNNEIKSFIKRYQIKICEGQRIEIPLYMEEVFDQMTNTLNKGMIVTIDYGYSNEEWQNPLRKDGSLRGYFQHQLIHNVLLHPGIMDITSHIHWDVLENMGRIKKLNNLGRWRQDEFLLKNGVLNELENHQSLDPFSNVHKLNRAIRSLIIPEGISSSFHILAQKK